MTKRRLYENAGEPSSSPSSRISAMLLPRSLLHHWWLVLLSLTACIHDSFSMHSPRGFQSQQWWGRLRGGSSVSQGSSFTTYNNEPPLSSSAAATNDHKNNQNTMTLPSNNDTADLTTNTTNATTNSNNNKTIPAAWKRQLPPPLCFKSDRTFQRIRVPYQNQVADIYLLGTAHVSNDSSRDVKLLLQSLEPDVIFVELCDQRTSLLEDPPELLQNLTLDTKNNSTKTKKPSFWDKVNHLQIQSNNSKMQCMATILLTQTQEEYADTLGGELGGEFRAAYRYWRSFPVSSITTSATAVSRRRPHLILGDRPLAITLARCWESLSWFAKIKVLFGLIVSSLFFKPNPDELRAWIQKILEDDETDLLSKSLEDLRKHLPTLERVIIQERDAYMACKLYQLCRGMLVSAAATEITHDIDDNLEADASTHKPIIIAALVGAGHVPGICAWLTTKTHPQGPEEILANLMDTKKFQDHDMSHFIFEITELQDLPGQ